MTDTQKPCGVTYMDWIDMLSNRSMTSIDIQIQGNLKKAATEKETAVLNWLWVTKDLDRRRLLILEHLASVLRDWINTTKRI